MRFSGIIVLVADVICSNGQVAADLVIQSQIVTGLDESVIPIRFGCDMDRYRRLWNEIIYLESVPYGRRDVAGLHMMAELDAVPEGEPEIGSLPMEGHVRDISQIKTRIE